MKAGTSVDDLLGLVNWSDLAQQKTTLIQIMWDDHSITDEQRGHLHGLLHFLDHIMDEAEAGGFPVVFLTEPEEGDDGKAQA